MRRWRRSSAAGPIDDRIEAGWRCCVVNESEWRTLLCLLLRKRGRMTESELKVEELKEGVKGE